MTRPLALLLSPSQKMEKHFVDKRVFQFKFGVQHLHSTCSHSVRSEDKFCASELNHFIHCKMMGSQAEQINERFHAIRRKLSEQNYKETFGAE